MSLFAKLRRRKEGNRISKQNATRRECAGHHETVSRLESSVWRKPREKHDGLKRRSETLSRLPRRSPKRRGPLKRQQRKPPGKLLNTRVLPGRGIQPVVIPTLDEIAAAKTRVQYEQGRFHFAVAGVAGSGKSSLINAIRGVENWHQDAAETGVVKTTVTIGRYPDPNPDLPFVWYDIPGAGTLHQPDWLYFNAQGLFVFDCVIVLFDNRFTETDIAILTNCRRFQIPTYIVRSKADVHIRNIMYEYGYDSAHDEVPRRESLYRTARKRFIADTRANVKRNLKQAELPDQRVYMVSNRTLLSIVRDRSLGFSYKIIDELELIKDILDEACSLRYAASADDDG
ncbi:interferon-inducible GTPase-domain-containing protein [Pisolithus microcarpus]|nr:interferon-inducible GTPase-domain-containing protein [Pisolithus microcarpus]